MDATIEIIDEAEDIIELVEEGLTLAGGMRIINSNSTVDETVSTDDSPYTFPNTPVLPKNSAGDTIGVQANLPSGVLGHTVAADVTHTNSDNSPAILPAGVPFVATLCTPCQPATVKLNTVTMGTIAAGGEQNYEVVDTANAGIGAPVSGKWQIANCRVFINGLERDSIKATQTKYYVEGNGPLDSGVVTSYQTGDTGYKEALRAGDFFTLTQLNPFGNYNRFTDENGLQVYPNNVFFDWKQWAEGKVQGYSRTHPATGNQASQVTNCRNFSVGPWTSGWGIQSRPEMQAIINGALANPYGYAPMLGHVDLSASIVTGDRYPSAPSAYCWALNSLGYVSPKDLTEGTRSLPTRLFTITVSGATVTLT